MRNPVYLGPLPPGLRVLDVHGNNITTLHETSLSATALEELNVGWATLPGDFVSHLPPTPRKLYMNSNFEVMANGLDLRGCINLSTLAIAGMALARLSLCYPPALLCWTSMTWVSWRRSLPLSRCR